MKKRLYITVDTECHDINNQDRYLWGETKDGERWGLEKILEEGRALNIPINFFVDIAEVDRYGLDFVKKVVDLITAYNQPVYLHLHPNFITGDDERSYLWQYDEAEQRRILHRAHVIWEDLFPNKSCVAFRAGRYGTDSQIYSLMKDEFGEGLIDLSYGSPGGKMCHLTKGEIGVDNVCKEYKGIIIFPNTTYVGLAFLGKTHNFGLDAAQTCLGEFVAVLKQNTVKNVILTMHSWNFIKTWFFRKGKVYKDKSALKRFRSMVEYAQKQGYKISSLNDFELIPNESDQIVELCNSFSGKVYSFYYNFIRFQRMGRLTPKYFKLFGAFYTFVLLIVILLISILI